MPLALLLCSRIQLPTLVLATWAPAPRQEYEELRVAQEAQIRRNRLATKTEPPAPDATIGDKRRTWTAAPVATKADQPFVRGAQGKWRVLTPGYLSTDSEGGSGEDDEGGLGEEDGQG